MEMKLAYKRFQDSNDNNDIELEEIIPMTEHHDVKCLINNNNKLLNISSNLILKKLLLNIRYNTILKLIKNNKLLQKKLGINLENYKEYIDFEYITKNEEKKNKIFKYGAYGSPLDLGWSFLIYVYTPLLVIYSIIANLTEIKLNENKYDTFISLTNKGLFGLIAITCISYYVQKGIENKKDSEKNYFDIIITLFFVIIYGLFEIMISLKIGIEIYKYKSKPFNWRYLYIFFDIIFLLANAYWTKLNYNNFQGFKERLITYETKYYLIRYKNMPIKEFIVDKKFITSNNINKIKYLKKIEKDLEYIEDDEINLKISEINNLRRDNNLNELIKSNTLPNCLINEPTRFIFYKNQNIFNLSDNKYIMKYKKGSFNLFNKEFTNFLLKKNINSITIVIQGTNEYILIFEDKKFIY